MPIQGYIEQLSNLQVRGWAYHPDRPDEHVLIEVSSGPDIIGTARASLFREDLKQANVGTGDHGFVVNFDHILDEKRLAAVNVHSVSSDLERSPLDFLKAPPTPAAAPVKSEPVTVRPHRDVLARQRPLFILGAARSGTSAIAQSLLKTGFYEGHEEGHLFDLAARLIDTVHAFYDDNGEESLRGTLIAQVPIRFLHEGIKDQFRAIARFCFNGDRWLDKTPRQQMIECAPLMREIWPEARFVFMKRRAIENISSRLRKFPGGSFADHCHDWSNAMRAWRRAREALGRYAIEIEQLEMATDPAGVVGRLAALVDLPAPVAAQLTEILAAEQPERTADRFGGTLDLDELDWSIDDKARFGQICMGEMAAFGYSFGRSYYSRPPGS